MKSNQIRQIGRKVLRIGLKVVGVLLLLLVVMEVVYRNQWVDTYKGALEGLNGAETLNKAGRTVLVMGDSFSAGAEGWVDELRERMPEFRIVNAAVAGTGVVQASILAPRRFETFKPDILVYQIYAGNDLVDYRYPIAWSRVGVMRNLYWWVAHRFRSVAWLNAVLGQSGGPSPAELRPVYESAFAVERYSGREKLLLEADPGLIEHQCMLSGGREKDMEGYLRRLGEVLTLCEEYGTVPYLLVLPHCAQVSEVYEKNMVAMGAEFSSAWSREVDYPFLSMIAGYTQGRAQVLNPLPMLQAEEEVGKRLFYPNDPHLNAEGQRLLGEWIWNMLRLPTGEGPEGLM